MTTSNTRLIHRQIQRTLTCALVSLILAPFAPFAPFAQGADASLAEFTKLTSAKVDNQLPLESTGSAASVQRTMRPALSYPTLRADNVTLRAAPDTEASPAAPEPLAEHRSAFSELVTATVGSPLPTFGTDIFGVPSDRFDAIDQISVPADYQIGPGDELYIQAWGTIEMDLRLTVDRHGCIQLPKVGQICLSSVAFSAVEDTITKTLQRAYKGFSLSVAMGGLRSIRIYVTGFAAAPGTYTVSSLASLINAALMTGGPGAAGDPRRVQLHRGGQPVASIDLYQFLIHGHRTNDLRLQVDDLIHVPPSYGQAAIAGNVNRPAIFHLASTDTMRGLIELAGGTLPGVDTSRVVVERFDGQGQRTVQEWPLNEDFLNMPAQPGDIVLLKPNSPRFLNAVTLKGHVAQPLRHEWHENMRVADLLPSADALIAPAYWQARNAAAPLSIELTAPQGLTVAPSFRDINWNYAVIERISRASAAVKLLPFHLHKAMIERTPEHNLKLQPGDRVTVFARGDFRTPIDAQSRFVRIEGEIHNAGVYPVGHNTTISELIELAGGLTDDAYLLGLELKRESVRAQQVLRKTEAISRLDEDYQRHLINRSRNVLSGDLSLAIPPEADAIANLISRLRATEPSGRIVIDLPSEAAAGATLPSLTLRDKDRIYIPPRPDTVEIVGAVLQPGSTLYTPHMRVKDYISRAGLIPTADRSEIYLVRPNGAFIKAGSRERLLAGDTVVVPEKVDRVSAVRRLKDWTQVLYQFGLGAAGLKLVADG